MATCCPARFRCGLWLCRRLRPTGELCARLRRPIPRRVRPPRVPPSPSSCVRTDHQIVTRSQEGGRRRGPTSRWGQPRPIVYFTVIAPYEFIRSPSRTARMRRPGELKSAHSRRHALPAAPLRWPTWYTARARAVSRSPERGLSVDPHPLFPRSRSPAWACVGVSCRLRVAYRGGTLVS